MNSETLSKFSEAALVEMIGNVEREIAAIEVSLDSANQRLLELTNAKKSVFAANFWKAHPELTPVNKGDKLAITDAFKANREEYGGYRSFLSYAWIEAGELRETSGMIGMSVEGYELLGGEYRKTGGVFFVPVEIVSGMRKAYLEIEATK